MYPRSTALKTPILSLLLLAIVWVGGFGIGSAVYMMHGDHQTGCTLSFAEQVVCVQSPFELLSAWQQSFAIPPAMLSMVLLVVVALWVLQRFRFTVQLHGPPPVTTLVRTLRQDHCFVHDPYVALFSQGILHPKAP